MQHKITNTTTNARSFSFKFILNKFRTLDEKFYYSSNYVANEEESFRLCLAPYAQNTQNKNFVVVSLWRYRRGSLMSNTDKSLNSRLTLLFSRHRRTSLTAIQSSKLVHQEQHDVLTTRKDYALHRSKLPSTLSNTDSLTIRVRVQLSTDIEETLTPPPSPLSSRSMSDIEFHIGDKSILCQSRILTERSDYFRNLFADLSSLSVKKNKNGRFPIKIQHTSYPAFLAFISYIHTHRLTVNSFSVLHFRELYLLSLKIRNSALRAAVEDTMLHYLDPTALAYEVLPGNLYSMELKSRVCTRLLNDVRAIHWTKAGAPAAKFLYRHAIWCQSHAAADFLEEWILSNLDINTILDDLVSLGPHYPNLLRGIVPFLASNFSAVLSTPAWQKFAEKDMMHTLSSLDWRTLCKLYATFMSFSSFLSSSPSPSSSSKLSALAAQVSQLLVQRTTNDLLPVILFEFAHRYDELRSRLLSMISPTLLSTSTYTWLLENIDNLLAQWNPTHINELKQHLTTSSALFPLLEATERVTGLKRD